MNPELGPSGRRLTGKKAIISLGLRQQDCVKKALPRRYVGEGFLENIMKVKEYNLIWAGTNSRRGPSVWHPRR